jgi:UDP-N-acetylglucosamine 2-epimerase (non-hydrolysing)
MLDQVLTLFEVRPDIDLNAMRPGQTLAAISSRMLGQLGSVLSREKPDLVFVQGDTTTTLCGALAAFYARLPVAHVEAGLRTGDIQQPFPEEMNRVLVARLSAVHFAATQSSAQHLRDEGVPHRSIQVTGNTGIDAVLHACRQLNEGAVHGGNWDFLDSGRKLVLVTAHRRESFGEGMERLCAALRQLAERRDVQIVYPVHPNPNVMEPVRRLLAGHRDIVLVEPLDYISFIDLARRAHLILTDSGGVQEEAPSLGKPVIVLRDKTERREAIDAGTATLVGTNTSKIVSAATRLLDDPHEYARRQKIHNPYGDGHASKRIAARVASMLCPELLWQERLCRAAGQ